MVKIEEINLGYSATLKAMIHIFAIPLFLFVLTAFIEKEWSLIVPMAYIVVISFSMWYRARKFNTYEYRYRRDVFFEILLSVILCAVGIIVLLIALSIV